MRTSELSKKISNRLLHDIVAGTLEGGQHISAQQVADRYGVSRTPVREALVSLEGQEILVRQENRGYFVSETLPASIKDRLADAATDESDDYQNLADAWLTNEIPEGRHRAVSAATIRLDEGKGWRLADPGREGGLGGAEGGLRLAFSTGCEDPGGIRRDLQVSHGNRACRAA